MDDLLNIMLAVLALVLMVWFVVKSTGKPRKPPGMSLPKLPRSLRFT